MSRARGSRGAGMRLVGGRNLLGGLTAMSRVVRPLSEANLRELSEQVKEGSQARAPEKTGALVDAHYVRQSGRGRNTTFKVGFDGVMNEDQVDYTMLMHEGLGVSGGGRYNLGPKSAEKNTGRPHHGEGVGMKFLTRSLEHHYRGLLKLSRDVMIETLRRAARARRRG